MTNPVRVTIALDGETDLLFEKLKKETMLSQSELVRKTIQFYWENRDLADSLVRSKVRYYTDMLLSGEHIILDVDHWLMFLELVESSPEGEHFWEKHKEVARSHAAQLSGKVISLEELLRRLEACNFYRLNKNSENDFTLVLGTETSRKFVKNFIQEFLSVRGLRAEIKEDILKLRVKLMK